MCCPDMMILVVVDDGGGGSSRRLSKLAMCADWVFICSHLTCYHVFVTDDVISHWWVVTYVVTRGKE